MKDFEKLDTVCFKAFLAAAEQLNFTSAASSASMTQSGVSQHIARLEEQLNTSLFLRIGKKVELTSAGKILRNFIENYFESIEKLTDKISEENDGLSGRVSYAMPASCLMSPHFPLLLKARQKSFGNLKLKVTLCDTDKVFNKILENEIDFGFVTKKIPHAEVEYIMFCPEEYALVGKDKDLLSEMSMSELKKVPMISYPGVEVLFEYWCHHYFRSSQAPAWSDLNIVGEINSLNGALTMVEAGAGLSFFPTHCLSKKLVTLPPKAGPGCFNNIYLIHLKGKNKTKRFEAVLKTFLEMVK